MSDLYSRHIVWLDSAKRSLTMIDIDDAYLDYTCFSTQQSLEFLIKHILCMRNIKFPKTHDIRLLKDLLEDSGFEYDQMQEMDVLADTITSWRDDARYTDGVRVEVDTIHSVFNIMDSINSAFLSEMETINK